MVARGIHAVRLVAHGGKGCDLIGSALEPATRMQNRDSGFESVTVPIGEGMEFSVRRG